MSVARDLHRKLEAYHAQVYFVPEAGEEYEKLGVDQAPMGYFASRSAAMGAVSAGTVAAMFFNFNSSPGGHRDPRGLEPDDARRAGRGPMPRRRSSVATDPRRRGRRARDDRGGPARTHRDRRAPEGRPLYAAHAGLDWPSEPHLVLWHATTLLREFRGDGHIAALVAAEIDGPEAVVMHAAMGDGAVPPDAAAHARLERRRLVGRRGPSSRPWAARRRRQLTATRPGAPPGGRRPHRRAAGAPWARSASTIASASARSAAATARPSPARARSAGLVSAFEPFRTQMARTDTDGTGWPFWAPSDLATVEAALDLAELAAGDRFVDLGCGDGQVLVAAARRGALVLGVEIDEELAGHAREALAANGSRATCSSPTSSNSTWRRTSSSPISLGTLQRLTPALRQLPHARLVTVDFEVPDLVADVVAGSAHLYRMPGVDRGRVEVGWSHAGSLVVTVANVATLSVPRSATRAGPSMSRSRPAVGRGTFRPGLDHAEPGQPLAIDIRWCRMPRAP